LFEFLMKCGKLGFPIGIISRCGPKYADATLWFALLRARSKRPNDRSAANK
jgi:hypothetical protein